MGISGFKWVAVTPGTYAKKTNDTTESGRFCKTPGIHYVLRLKSFGPPDDVLD